jgi:hypothetical protein
MTQALPKFPNFDSFVCIGDRRTVEVGPFTIAAVVHHDTETRPTDFDCYFPEQVESWNRDEWSFVGVVLSVFVDDVCVSEHAASLWGIDCNVPGSDNDYLSECADDLLLEALEAARVASRKIAAAIAV